MEIMEDLLSYLSHLHSKANTTPVYDSSARHIISSSSADQVTMYCLTDFLSAEMCGRRFHVSCTDVNVVADDSYHLRLSPGRLTGRKIIGGSAISKRYQGLFIGGCWVPHLR